MEIITRFDKSAGGLITRIPQAMHKPFDVLGHLTMPGVWAGVLALLVLFEMRASAPFVTTLVILCLTPLSSFIKMLVRRRRPQTIYADGMRIKSYSFPSGHAYCAALAGGYLAYMAFAAGNPVLGVGLLVLVFTIGVSRVHLGAHFPSDVVAGWLLGAGLTTLVILLPLP